MTFGVSSTGYSRTDSREIPDVWAHLDAARSFIDAYQAVAAARPEKPSLARGDGSIPNALMV